MKYYVAIKKIVHVYVTSCKISRMQLNVKNEFKYKNVNKNAVYVKQKTFTYLCYKCKGIEKYLENYILNCK